MQITTFTKPKAVLTVVTALVFIIDPNIIINLFGTQLEAAGVMMTRILGGAYLVSGVGIWSINGPSDISAGNAWLYALGESIAVASILMAMSVDGLNLLGWALALAYVVFVAGFIFVALEVRRHNV